MEKTAAAVYADLRSHSEVWDQLPAYKVAGLIGEYKALADTLASVYGSFHSNFTGDGHLFLFDGSDGAVQFSLKLIKRWRDGFEELPAFQGIKPIQIRLGCHYGRVSDIQGGAAWVGTGIIIANRIQSAAPPDSLLVSINIIDLIDRALYKIQQVKIAKHLKGDHPVLQRPLYGIAEFDERGLVAKPEGELGAEGCFLKAVAMIGTEKEDSKEQIESYTKAIERKADYSEAYLGRGVVYNDIGEYEKAIADYSEAIKLRPNYPEAYYRRGNAYLYPGEYAKAIADHTRALELRPYYARAHLVRAAAYLHSGEYAKAIADYTRALELRPNLPEAYTQYERLLLHQRQREEARFHLEKALALAEPTLAEREGLDRLLETLKKEYVEPVPHREAP